MLMTTHCVRCSQSPVASRDKRWIPELDSNPRVCLSDLKLHQIHYNCVSLMMSVVILLEEVLRRTINKLRPPHFHIVNTRYGGRNLSAQARLAVHQCGV